MQRASAMLTILLLTAACAPAGPASEPCMLADDDAAWLQPSVDAWAGAMREYFSIDADTLPQMIVLGTSCVWAAGDDARASLGAAARKSASSIALNGTSYPVFAAPLRGAFHAPNGQDIAPAPLAFTSPAETTKRPFFMIASAEIWRGVLPADKAPDIAKFIEGVAVHELVHTEHAPIMAHLDEILSDDPELADISDEWLYQNYKDAPGYADSIAEEKAMMIAALRASDAGERQRFAAAAINIYRHRQHSYFGERRALFRDMEDTFLTMEGVAVWLAFRSVPPEGAVEGGAGAIADYFEAGGGGSWVQTEGGLMAAVLESLAPDWREHVFAPDWARLPDLLEAAAQGALR